MQLDEGALLRRQPPRLILLGGRAAAAASALAADAQFVRQRIPEVSMSSLRRMPGQSCSGVSATSTRRLVGASPDRGISAMPSSRMRLRSQARSIGGWSRRIPNSAIRIRHLLRWRVVAQVPQQPFGAFINRLKVMSALDSGECLFKGSSCTSAGAWAASHLRILNRSDQRALRTGFNHRWAPWGHCLTCAFG